MIRMTVAALVCLLAGAATLAQELTSNLGMLTCTAVDGDKKADAATPADTADLQCSFKPTKSGPEETYSGTIQRVGQKALSGKVVLMWVVSAPPTTQLVPGLLEQTYVSGKPLTGTGGADGSSVDQVLYGQEKKSITLRQIKNPGAESMTPAVTIVDLHLKLARA
jgi:hypothetical protein